MQNHRGVPNGDSSYSFGGCELTLHQHRGSWIFKYVEWVVFSMDRECNKLYYDHLAEEL